MHRGTNKCVFLPIIKVDSADSAIPEEKHQVFAPMSSTLTGEH